MASINGISVKSLKTFKDHEGASIAQGNIYCDGKKVGFWSQDSWGGPDSFDGCGKIVSERAEKFAAGYPKDDKYAWIQKEPDVFMGNLILLMEIEKMFKKFEKKGGVTGYFMFDGYHISGIWFKQKLTKEDIEKKYAGDVKKMESNMFKNATIRKWAVFGEKPFEIICDEKHPVPEFFFAS